VYDNQPEAGMNGRKIPTELPNNGCCLLETKLQ
jgi:hypothetical protein